MSTLHTRPIRKPLPQLLLSAPKADNRFTGLSPTDRTLSPISSQLLRKKHPLPRNAGPSSEKSKRNMTAVSASDSMEVDTDEHHDVGIPEKK